MLRYPALALIAVIAPAVQFLLTFLPLSQGVATGCNAVAVAVAGLLTAVFLRRDQLVPAFLGVGQAVLVLVLGLGYGLTDEQQALWMTVVGLVVGAFVHTQVAPRVAAPVVVDNSYPA